MGKNKRNRPVDDRFLAESIRNERSIIESNINMRVTYTWAFMAILGFIAADVLADRIHLVWGDWLAFASMLIGFALLFIVILVYYSHYGSSFIYWVGRGMTMGDLLDTERKTHRKSLYKSQIVSIFSGAFMWAIVSAFVLMFLASEFFNDCFRQVACVECIVAFVFGLHLQKRLLRIYEIHINRYSSLWGYRGLKIILDLLIPLLVILPSWIVFSVFGEWMGPASMLVVIVTGFCCGYASLFLILMSSGTYKNNRNPRKYITGRKLRWICGVVGSYTLIALAFGTLGLYLEWISDSDLLWWSVATTIPAFIIFLDIARNKEKHSRIERDSMIFARSLTDCELIGWASWYLTIPRSGMTQWTRIESLYIIEEFDRRATEVWMADPRIKKKRVKKIYKGILECRKKAQQAEEMYELGLFDKGFPWSKGFPGNPSDNPSEIIRRQMLEIGRLCDELAELLGCTSRPLTGPYVFPWRCCGGMSYRRRPRGP